MTHEEAVTFHVAQRRALLPRPADDPLPLPDQGARRAAPARRRAAHARVHHEGLLLASTATRRGSTSPTRSTSRPTTGSSTAPACEWYRVESDVGMMGGIGRARVHGAVPGGRERRRAVATPATPPTSRSRRADAAAGRRCRAPLDAPERGRDAGRDDDRGGRRAQLGRRPRRAAEGLSGRASTDGGAGARRSCAATTASTRSSSQNALGEPFRPATEDGDRATRSARAGLHRAGRRRRARCSPTSARRAGRLRRGRQRDRTATCAASSPAATSRSSVRRRAHGRGGRPRRTAARSASSRRSRSATSSSSARATPSRSARPTSTRTGKEQPIVMGSYGIGPARIVAAAIEQYADEQGISWPRALAPWRRAPRRRSARPGTPEREAGRARSTPSCATAGLDVALRRPRRRRRARSSPTPSCSAARCG